MLRSVWARMYLLCRLPICSAHVGEERLSAILFVQTLLSTLFVRLVFLPPRRFPIDSTRISGCHVRHCGDIVGAHPARDFKQRHPHSTMSSDLSLWCYYWEHGNLSPFEIKVPPNATVDNCMRRILQRRKSDSPIGCTRLYKIPQNHPVPLHDIESTLGALSVSDLGSHLHIHELMQDIFQPHPEEGHLHLVLVDRGMYRLWLQCDGTNISY